MTEKTWTIELKPDPDQPDETLLEFPDDFCAEADWRPGDELKWVDLGNGSWAIENLSKQQREKGQQKD